MQDALKFFYLFFPLRWDQEDPYEARELVNILSLNALFCLKTAHRKEKPRVQGLRIFLMVRRSRSGCSRIRNWGLPEYGAFPLFGLWILLRLESFFSMTNSQSLSTLRHQPWEILMSRIRWDRDNCQFPLCSFYKKSRVGFFQTLERECSALSLQSQINLEHKRSTKAAHRKHWEETQEKTNNGRNEGKKYPFSNHSLICSAFQSNQSRGVSPGPVRQEAFSNDLSFFLEKKKKKIFSSRA